MGKTPKALAKDKIYILKLSGEKIGPYKATVDSRRNRVEVFDDDFNSEIGDTLIRPTAPGRDEFYLVEDVHYEQVISRAFAPFELDVKRQGAPERPTRGSVTNTYHISDSQNIQIGDHNMQNVISVMQSLVNEIERADSTPEQKAQALGHLQTFLTHPLITSITGGAAGALVGAIASKT